MRCCITGMGNSVNKAWNEMICSQRESCMGRMQGRDAVDFKMDGRDGRRSARAVS